MAMAGFADFVGFPAFFLSEKNFRSSSISIDPSCTYWNQRHATVPPIKEARHEDR
jgi:hypothetical protein